MLGRTGDAGYPGLEGGVSEDFHGALVEDVGAGGVGCGGVAGEEDGFYGVLGEVEGEGCA